MTRYRTPPTAQERERACAKIAAMVKTRSDSPDWTAFCEIEIGLDRFYVPGVIAVVRAGVWKNRKDPLDYVKKGAPRALHIPPTEPEENRAAVFVSSKIHPDLKKPLTVEEALHFNPRKRNRTVGVGAISQLNTPAPTVQDQYDGGPDMSYQDRCDFFGGNLQRSIESSGGHEEYIDWDCVAVDAQLDSGEVLALEFRLDGVSEADAVSSESPSGARDLRAAFRRLRGKWSRVEAAMRAQLVESEPIRPEPVPRPAPGSAIEAMAIHAERQCAALNRANWR